MTGGAIDDGREPPAAKDDDEASGEGSEGERELRGGVPVSGVDVFVGGPWAGKGYASG